jgi:hypothetical protein
MMKYLVVLALALVSGCATPSVSNDTHHWRYVNESTDDRTMWSSTPSDPPQSSHHEDICRSDSPDHSAYFQALHAHNLTRAE